MSVSDSSKVDLLYKKLFGVSKTDTAGNKSPSNETIASPYINRGDKVWIEASSIPATAPGSSTTIVQNYQTTSAVQCTADTTTTPISSVYPTWKTNLTDWIPPEFGSDYFIKVYSDNTGVANVVSSGTQMFDSGIAGVGEWFFDFQSGTLNFIGGTIPTALTSAKVVYVSGYRYIGKIGIASSVANTVYTQAVDVTQNTRLTIIEATDVTQNTAIAATNAKMESSYFQANGAFIKANSAYDTANSAQANTIIIQGVDVTQNTNIAATDNKMQYAYGQANTGTVLAQAAYFHANGSFIKANAGYDTANSAQSNTIIIQGVDTTQNTRLTVIEGTDATQNTWLAATDNKMQYAYGQANTGTVLAQASYIQANVTIGVDATQNTRLTVIEGTNSTQNTWLAATDGKMQSAYDFANTRFASAGGTISGQVTISGNNDLIVTGNLIIGGNVTTQNLQELAVADPLITLGIGNYFSDIRDIGFAAHYNDGSNAHAGIIRDSATKEFYIFQGYTPELDANNNININHASFQTAKLNANEFHGNVIANTVVVNGGAVVVDGINLVSVNNTQNTRLTVIEGTNVTQNTAISSTNGKMESAYGQANTGTVLAQAAYIQANVTMGVDATQNTNIASTDSKMQNAYFQANGAFIKANSAYDTANSATANTIIIQGVDLTQNAYIAATDNKMQFAYDQANTGTVLAQAAYFHANGSFIKANSAYDNANSAQANIVVIQGVNLTQNTNIASTDGKMQYAYGQANTGTVLAQASYNQANVTIGVDATQNTNISSTDGKMSSAYNQANTGTVLAQAGFNLANTNAADIVIIQGTNVTQNTNIASTDNKMQYAYGQANTGTVLAQAGFNLANTNAADIVVIQGTNVTQNNNIIIIQGVNLTQNTAIAATDGKMQSAFDKANTIMPSANGNTSAYASKYFVEFNPSTNVFSYSSYPDASNPYITGYGPEIHVSPVALNDNGRGTIGDPVKTIARAQVLAALAFETTSVGERKTIILHPGDYTENVTIDTQFTVLTTHELVGKNTTLSGTLTLNKGCTIDGLKMTNLVISANSATGTVDLIGCTVTTSTTKTSSAYTVFRGCDLSFPSTLSITGSGTVIMVGGNYGSLTVNNAGASVLAKAVITMGPVTLTAGTLQLSDTLIYSATNTSNAITQSAGSVITVNNCQTLIPNLTNVSRNSFGGFYSILHSVYDKPNSTFGGTSLNAISYSQYINADRLTLSSGGQITYPDGSIQISSNGIQAAFTQANTGTVLAQASYDQANVTIGVDATQNTRLTVIEGTDVTQNTRLTVIEGTNTTQNNIITIIQGVDLTQNTNIASTDGKMQSAYNQANTGTTLAQAAYNQANTETVIFGWTPNTIIVANTAGYISNSSAAFVSANNTIVSNNVAATTVYGGTVYSNGQDVIGTALAFSIALG
jgi:hypothetical protein